MPPILASRWRLHKGFGRRTLCSLLMALLVTALVVASYGLSGGRSDLVQVFSAFLFRDFALTSNKSGTERQTETDQLTKPCSVNLTYITPHMGISLPDGRVIQLAGRRIPDTTELEQYEPHLFSVIPQQFLHLSRSPCWYQKYDGNSNSDPYGTNAYTLYGKRLQTIFEKMRQRFWATLQLRKGQHYRLRCLPHFYILGQPKCGTTDLYDRLRLHPNIQFSAIKEPHWWTRKRFGIVNLKEPFHKPFPLEDYLDLFDMAAQKIQDHHIEGTELEAGQLDPILSGEASASTMWDNSAWSYFYDNVTNTEPPVLIQDFIHAIHPRSKFIVILRNPVERLYSDYLYFAIANKSAEDFNDKVNESLQMFESCLQGSSLRSCAYNATLSNILSVRLQVGLYVVYLWDWLTVFDLDQFLILCLEDYAANISQSMNLVYTFLSLGPLSDEQTASIAHKQASNSRRPKDSSLGPMLPHTRQLLLDFYRPYNQKLSEVLANSAYLWDT
ncbi:carbohydrate sulfotransferase 15 isoform X2 [Mixophyes fleayi]|uniref:carbohydrate sulfotransferase 15 isoform X2 n=1 Tax=Mixophyes fleayi TaxID=3061075 RepID=UPI003F4D7394